MGPEEAAAVVQAMSDSLRSDPHQFYVSVNVVGQNITSYGGTGLEITAIGGGPGSSTVGQEVSLDGAAIRVSKDQAEQAMREEVTALVNSLDAIAVELRSSSCDKSEIQSILDSLKDTWVPGVIIGVLSNVLSAAIGL